jgi:hypothetical protein
MGEQYPADLHDGPLPFDGGIYVPQQPPAADRVIAMLLNIFTIMTLTYCLCMSSQ